MVRTPTGESVARMRRLGGCGKLANFGGRPPLPPGGRLGVGSFSTPMSPY
jgi:hypothetical protein